MEGETAVLVAGDPEREHMRKVEKDGGIHYHVNLMEAMVSSMLEGGGWGNRSTEDVTLF